MSDQRGLMGEPGDRRRGAWGAFEPRAFHRAPFIMCVVFLLASSGGAADTANRIVAIVNDEIITEADVTSHVEAVLDNEEIPASERSDSAAVHHVVLRRLIDQRLMRQEAKRAGVSVSPEEVLERLTMLQGRFRSVEEFDAFLKEGGVSKEQLKEQLRDQLVVQRLIDERVRATIVVSPQEVARVLSAHPEWGNTGDRVRVSHLLIRVNEHRSAEQALALIEDLSRQLTSGADFATLATRYSEDAHGPEGGSLGWVAPGELLPELAEALLSLKGGELSRPIQSSLGFHLLKVEERQAPSTVSVTEANLAVSKRLYQQKQYEQAEAKALAAGDFDRAGWRAYQAGWVQLLQGHGDLVLAASERCARRARRKLSD